MRDGGTAEEMKSKTHTIPVIKHRAFPVSQCWSFVLGQWENLCSPERLDQLKETLLNTGSS